MKKILGRLELSGPSTMGLLLRRRVGENNSQRGSPYQGLLPLESEEEEGLPFNEVTQEVKRVDRFLFVLFEWQPAEPVGQDLADVDALWPEPHDLPHGRDAVLCGVYVLFGARVASLDDADQHGDGLWRRETKSTKLHTAAHEPQWRVAPIPTCAVLAVAFASELSHNANAVSGRLPNLRSQVP